MAADANTPQYTPTHANTQIICVPFSWPKPTHVGQMAHNKQTSGLQPVALEPQVGLWTQMTLAKNDKEPVSDIFYI